MYFPYSLASSTSVFIGTEIFIFITLVTTVKSDFSKSYLITKSELYSFVESQSRLHAYFLLAFKLKAEISRLSILK